MATQQDRKRVLRVGATALSSAAARAVTMLISLVSVPICLGYLGTASYGIWATLTSVIGLMAFADFGIGNGLMNSVASSLGRDDPASIRRTLSNGLALLCGLGMLLLCSYLLTAAFFPWPAILGISAEADPSSLSLALLVLFVILALNLPTGIVQRLMLGLQLGYWFGIIQIGGSALALLAMLATVRFDWGLAGMLGANLGGPLLATMIGGWVLLSVKQSFRPRVTDVNGAEVRRLASTGAVFFVLQLGASLSFASDNVVIAHVLGTEAVTGYSVHQKLFALVQTASSLALMPLWPTYAEALARNDRTWIRSALKWTVLLFPAGAAVVSVMLVYGAPAILKLWVGSAVVSDPTLCWALMAWVTVETAGRTIAIFLNGVSVLRAQIVVALVFLMICLPLKFIFAGLWGVTGVPWAVSLTYLFVHVPAYWWLIRRWLREPREQVVQTPEL